MCAFVWVGNGVKAYLSTDKQVTFDRDHKRWDEVVNAIEHCDEDMLLELYEWREPEPEPIVEPEPVIEPELIAEPTTGVWQRILGFFRIGGDS